MESLVSIIIVNWNGKENLRECLESLAKINYGPYEILLVDNGSVDGSVEHVKTHFPKVEIIQNKENLGFAKANNQGLKKAKGEYILFLNNDTKVTHDFLTKLVDVMERDKKIGVVQPKIIFLDSEKLQAGGAFLTNTGFLYHFGFGKDPKDKKYNQSMEIFSANGSCLLVKREVIEKVGLFDPDFFCYFEETDFCWRLWLAGYKIVYVPEAVIYHKGRQTTERLSSSFVIFYPFKNRICSLIKNLGTFELIKILPLHLLFCQLASFAYLMSGRLSSALAVQKAILWNMQQLRKTLKKRKKIQGRLRKVRDSKFVPLLTKRPRLAYYYYLFNGRLEDYQE